LSASTKQARNSSKAYKRWSLSAHPKAILRRANLHKSNAGNGSKG